MAVVLFPSHSYTSTYPLSHSPCPASSSTFTTYPPSPYPTRKRPPPPLASSLSYRSRSPKSAKTCASIGSVSRSCATATRTTSATSTSTSSAAEEMKGLGERRGMRTRTIGIELSVGLVFPLPPSSKGPQWAVQPNTMKADKPATYTSKSKEQKRDQVTVTVEEVHSDPDSSDSDLDSDSERDGEEDYYTNLRLAQRTPIRTSPLSFAPNSKYPLQLSSHSPPKSKSKSRNGGMNLYKLAIRHCMRESEEGRRILMVGAKRAVGVFQATRELERIVQRSMWTTDADDGDYNME